MSARISKSRRAPSIRKKVGTGVQAKQVLKQAAQARIMGDAARTEDLLLALESANTGICMVDQKCRVTYINPYGSRMLGCPSKTLQGRPISRCFKLLNSDGKLVPISSGPVGRAIKTGKDQSIDPEQGYQLRTRRTIFYVAMRISPIQTRGRVRGAAIFFRDVTQRRKIEKAKTEFVSLAAHELRTPLSIISLNLNIIESLLPGAVRAQLDPSLEAVKSAVERMSGLMGRLLNVARIDTGELVSSASMSDIGELVRLEAKESASLAKRRGVRLKVNVSPRLPKIKTDPQLIRIVIENLLANAIKYSKEGGMVSVRVARRGKMLVIEVKDQGIGIPSQDQKKIFTKLFRARNVRHIQSVGTGLGLYLVKTIVDELGGTIDFASVEGQGTTFTIRFPIG